MPYPNVANALQLAIQNKHVDNIRRVVWRVTNVGIQELDLLAVVFLTVPSYDYLIVCPKPHSDREGYWCSVCLTPSPNSTTPTALRASRVALDLSLAFVGT